MDGTISLGRPKAWAFSAAGLLAALALPALPSAEEKPGEIPRGAHGAATMEFQESSLARLLADADPLETPAGFDPVIWEAFLPKDNRPAPERIALGRRLYFDVRLSADGTVSCATAAATSGAT